jgi:PIN domain nuclease of toxin-antitoxin system
MRLLLDTHAFLWWAEDAAALSRRARRSIADPKNECFFSIASCWEMAIKLRLGKLRLATPFDRFVPEQMAANQFRLLDVGFRHVARVASLPLHHRDPFDRLLIAQALEEELACVSADGVFERYGAVRIW